MWNIFFDRLKVIFDDCFPRRFVYSRMRKPFMETPEVKDIKLLSDHYYIPSRFGPELIGDYKRVKYRYDLAIHNAKQSFHGSIISKSQIKAVWNVVKVQPSTGPNQNINFPITVTWQT
ncbi:hypothetical protein WA026_016541 [Henosepilachna vigintioctopunctata]|uniref:Uncharacterized protein n=1 Tax=Henosepilachna vigintioctopunctata TaxID=420089 RepID=A0AAW1VEJ6_9CUCU